MAKREYRGQRSADSFVDFVREQNKDPIKEYQNLEELQEMDDTKRYLIGYFETKDSPEYTNFRKVASNLKDDCIGNVQFFRMSCSFCTLGGVSNVCDANPSLNKPSSLR